MARIAKSATVVVLALALVVVATATAATPKPKPWQWTAAQATRDLLTHKPRIHPGIPATPSSIAPADLAQAACRGQGKAVARRYSTFRCTATFEAPKRGLLPPLPPDKRVLWAKVRRVGTGQLCIALDSLSAIPVPCLATSGPPRVLGSYVEAAMALRRWLPAKIGGDPRLAQGTFGCLDHGAGYYACTFDSTRDGSVNVTMTTKGPRFTNLVLTT